jgi:hypothetical protein
MLTYRRSDKLEVIGYTDSDFMGYVDSLKSISSYIFMLAGGTIFLEECKANHDCLLHHGSQIHCMFRGIEPWNMANDVYHGAAYCGYY